MGETVLFGRYRLLEPAGSGGSAQVWRAIDTESGDEVAVKRLHPMVFGDDAARLRLEREFRALRSLDDPHIVRVRDLHVSEDEAALVLDYVRGPSVAERLANGPPFDDDEALSIVTDVAEALATAHAAGIVHRDVTPGNVLLDPGDGARLTDFGIALGGAGGAAVTATGQLMGTLRYLAPEQLRGAAATPATDLHALAAVAYELLAGHPAYPATTPVALAEAQAAGPPPITSKPAAVDAAVRRGLATDPSDRPSDVRTFAADLRAALEGAQTQLFAVPIEAGDPREPMWEPGAVEGTADPAAPEPAVAVATPPSPRSASAPEPRRATSRRSPALVVAILAVILAGTALAALAPDGRDQAAGAGDSIAPTPTPVATPTPSPTPDEKPGKGNDDNDDKGKGNGNGNGNGNDGGDD